MKEGKRERCHCLCVFVRACVGICLRETEGKRKTYRKDKEEKVETNYIIDICIERGAR